MCKLIIVGYERDQVCGHCGRNLKHGIKLSDARVVGAQCLNKALTQPKVVHGKKVRVGASYIIRTAKVVQFIPADRWLTYGVVQESTEFEALQQ